MEEAEQAAGPSSLPPPPPRPDDYIPDRVSKYSITARPGFGTQGNRITLLSNHFRALLNAQDAMFYQYDVEFSSEEDSRPVISKKLGRRLIDKLYQTYSSELNGKEFAYDGERTLYTVGSLPRNKLDFTVLLEGSFAKREVETCGDNGNFVGSGKRPKYSLHSRTYRVQMSYAAKIPLKAVSLALKGAESNAQDALRVLDIVLSQQAARRDCLLVRQSFFHNDLRNSVDVGGGVIGIRGFHTSFHLTHGGLSLNTDVSTTMILKPGPVLDFLLANQNVREPRHIDWVKAKKMLKNLRVKATHRNVESKIIGLSEKPCNQQVFSMKVKNDGGIERTVDVTVHEYFRHIGIQLTYSAYMPCLDIGKPKRPSYLPLELCYLVSLQRYTKALSGMQRASLVERSRQRPQEKLQTLTDAAKTYRFDEDPLFAECGLSIDKQLTHVHGRVLEPPMLEFGKGENFTPRNGRWNLNNKEVLQPVSIERWVIVNFSARCDTSHISRELINAGRRKGFYISCPLSLTEEDPQYRRRSPIERVEKMYEQLFAKFAEPLQFILCVLPERKNSDIYGPWKKRSLCDVGVVTQCISPSKMNDQYFTNVLLKINSKLGGKNSLLAIERMIPLINEIPTMILGMDVSHGSPSCNTPSIAAVVGSRCWPLVSRYRASLRTLSPKVELIDSLYKPLTNGEDGGMMRELLLDFYTSTGGRKPKQIIVFRDGVSESQFSQILDFELQQIIKSYQHLKEVEFPKFTVVVAQKRHHTKLFQANRPDNVPPGTVVDTKIVHPTNYDFYMCAHAGVMGTSRPAHYHVLLDEIGFSVDGLQNLIHSLSYVYQRSTSATSIVAPIMYAHSAALQMQEIMKFEDLSEASSGHSSGPSAVPELPRLQSTVASSMFFC